MSRTPARVPYPRMGIFGARSLKSCPLCRALNARESLECFVCRWRGEFEHHPDIVGDGLARIIERCPGLGVLTLPRARQVSIGRRLMERLRRFLGSRLDLHV